MAINLNIPIKEITQSEFVVEYADNANYNANLFKAQLESLVNNLQLDVETKAIGGSTSATQLNTVYAKGLTSFAGPGVGGINVWRTNNLAQQVLTSYLKVNSSNLSEFYVDTLKVGNLFNIDQTSISITNANLSGNTTVATGGSLAINSPVTFTSGMTDSMSYEYRVQLTNDPTEILGSNMTKAVAEIRLTKNMPNHLFVKFVASADFHASANMNRNSFKIKLSFESGGLRPTPGQIFNISFIGMIDDSSTPNVLIPMAGTVINIVPGEDYETTNTIAYTDVDVTSLGVKIGSSPSWKNYKTNVQLLTYYDVNKIATDGIKLHIMNTYNTL